MDQLYRGHALPRPAPVASYLPPSRTTPLETRSNHIVGPDPNAPHSSFQAAVAAARATRALSTRPISLSRSSGTASNGSISSRRRASLSSARSSAASAARRCSTTVNFCTAKSSWMTLAVLPPLPTAARGGAAAALLTGTRSVSRQEIRV